MINRMKQRCKYIEKINYCQVKEGPHHITSNPGFRSLRAPNLTHVHHFLGRTIPGLPLLLRDGEYNGYLNGCPLVHADTLIAT